MTSAVNRVNRQVVERYRYSPYGETTVLTPEFTPKTDNTLENEYTYTGRRLDPSGLMYFRARYYDPQTGQFISRDPLGYVDGMSLYRGYFVPGSMDPSGTDTIDPDSSCCYDYCVGAGGTDKACLDYCSGSPSCGSDDPTISGTHFMGPPLPPSSGTPIPNSGGRHQNCQGAGCGIVAWLQPTPQDFRDMRKIGAEKWFKENFNPMAGHGTCRVTECTDNPMMFSPCECGEREVFGWLALRADNSVIDAHFAGRTVAGAFAPAYESKAGPGARFEDITDPDGHNSQIYGNLKPAKNVRVCWCCERK